MSSAWGWREKPHPHSTAESELKYYGFNKYQNIKTASLWRPVSKKGRHWLHSLYTQDWTKIQATFFDDSGTNDKHHDWQTESRGGRGGRGMTSKMAGKELEISKGSLLLLKTVNTVSRLWGCSELWC